MNCVRELAISGPLSRSINKVQAIRHEVAGIARGAEDEIDTLLGLVPTACREMIQATNAGT
jgi:hypothetical protein